MVKAILNDKMIQELRALKGDFLENIEGMVDEDRAFGNIRINTTQSSIELECTPKTEKYFDKTEDICYFSCILANRRKKFIPYLRKRTKKKIINEKIEGIALIRAIIELPKYKYAIEIDQAIEIKTSNNTIIFFNQECFTEGIQISMNCLLDDIYPISKVVEFWGENSEQAIVKRSVIEL